MAINKLSLKTLEIEPGESFQSLLIYPSLVLFESLQKVRVILLESNDDEENSDKCFTFNESIKDKIVEDNFLWLVLDSGKLVVIDVLNLEHINIECNNYKICEVRQTNSCQYLISASGEVLASPYSVKELVDMFEKGISEISVSLHKLPISHSNLPEVKEQWCIDQLNFNVLKNNILATCPVTGINKSITSEVSLYKGVSWGELAVLSAKHQMWIVDLINSQILYHFENTDDVYYPLDTNNDIFYYLLFNQVKVTICCAHRITISPSKNEKYNEMQNSSMKQSNQEALKQQLKLIVEAVCTSTEDTQVESILQSLYEKIDDFNYLIEMGLKLCIYDVAYKSLFNLIKSKVISSDNIKLKNNFIDTLNKVEIIEYFRLRNTKNYDDKDIVLLNAKQICAMFLKNSDIDLACVCWLKYSQYNLTINSEDIVNLVDAIPNNIKMSTLIIWLKSFVPTVLDLNPFFIDIIVRWTTERVLLLEKSAYWPKIGIKFIEEIISVLELSLKTIAIRPLSMDDLDLLKDRICHVLELKEKYRINMLLEELSSLSSNEVAIIMLHRCYTEDLQSYLIDYLPNYTSQHLLEIDHTLQNFIESEAVRGAGGIDGHRLRILLNSFRSHNNKLDCLLQVLKVLDVPWNNIVTELATEAAASATKDFTITDSDRMLAQEIEIELNFAKVKVVLKKYNFPTTCNDYILILHKIANAPIIEVNDMKVITTVVSSLSNYSNILYINRCLQDCEIRTALEYFAKLPKRDKQILLKSIMSKFEQIVISYNIDPVLEKNYVDFLKGTRLLSEIKNNNVEGLYHLKNSYNIKVSLNNFHIETFSDQTIGNWLMKNRIAASSGRGGCVEYLTRASDSQHLKIATLLRQTSANENVRKVVEKLFNFSQQNKTDENILELFSDSRNTTLLQETCDIIVELVNNCHEEELHYLIKFLSILNALINANIIVKNLSITWKFNYIFMPISSVTATNYLIKFYAKVLSDSITSSDFKNYVNRGDLVYFRMTNCLNQYTNEVVDIEDKLSKRLLLKIISSQELDELLITLLLLIINKSEQHDKMWILDILRGQNETLPPNVMHYLSYSPIRQVFSLEDILSSNATSYTPQYILKSKFNLNLADIALPDATEETWDAKMLLFYVLNQYPDTSISRLVDLSRTLNISVNYGLSLQLMSLLTTWELKYNTYLDNLQCRRVRYESDEKELMAKCFVIWDSIDNKDFIKDILNDFWKNGEVTLQGRSISVNPYYYEIFLCIYHLMFESNTETRSGKEYFLLNYLKNYERKSAPKQYEFELFSIKGMFPEIGHYRLPFHLFMRDDMWANLKSEITLETYEKWLPAVALLALHEDVQTAKDMICSNALKQTMTSRRRNDGPIDDFKDNEPWNLMAREEPLLRAAHKCVRYIANMEWAAACLFYVLQGCARGADQVAAAQLCYQFAQRWAALQPGNKAVRQMERLHCTLSTRHALQKIEWANEEFLRLSTEPAQLIRALYFHPSFIDKINRYDINRAANEIADKNGINISTIRIQMLENLLEKPNDTNRNKKSHSLETNELMIAKYILKATCPKMGAIYLSRIAFDEDTDFNKVKKLRALQCLISVVEADVLKVLNKDRDFLWSALVDLLYVVKLEHIDMPWVVATFMQDKECALEQLVQSLANNVEGLIITSSIAKRFGNTKITRQLIPILLRMSLNDEVIPLLLKVTPVSVLDDIISSAWQSTILNPFQRADYPITEKQKYRCLTVLNLLPACPVIKEDDLVEIWKNCERCKCIGIGCLVLPYMSLQSRLLCIRNYDKRNLIVNLKKLQADTYLVNGAMSVLENIKTRM